MGKTVEVQQFIAADAEALYDMVSDVSRMGEWSPETVRCVWVRRWAADSVG